jgi:SAM-dependent methyltransferase
MTSSQSDTSADPSLSVEFWEGRYQADTARWDLGQAAPPLVSLLQSAQAPAPGTLIALGIGRGHDALLFAAQGFEVTGVDFAPSAIAATAAAATQRQLPIHLLESDIFTLPADYAGQFDYVMEHTCFCAIAPVRRPEYVQVVRSLLRPGGEFIGLFWAHDMAGGPPYGSTPEEIRQLFAADFQVESLEKVTNSIPQRANAEYLARFPLRAAV